MSFDNLVRAREEFARRMIPNARLVKITRVIEVIV